MRRNHPSKRQSGFILVVVLGAVLILAALLFGFNQRTRSSLAAAEALRNGEQSWNGAWAGVQIAVARVRDANDRSEDGPSEPQFTGDVPFSLGETEGSLTIIDESGLLNVNRLKDETGRFQRARIDQFLRLIDLLNRRRDAGERIGYGIVPAILDWTDTDDEVTHLDFVQGQNTGAEHGYYQTCRPPYPCRNGPVDMVDHLLSVKGMTPEHLGRLRPYLTCAGDGKININAAPKLVIQSLSEQIGGALAEMIVEQRQRKPFGSIAELAKVPGMTDETYRAIRPMVTTRPRERHYRVISEGIARGQRCRIEAVLKRNTESQNVEILYYREL
mgnify:CR=1 FL=1